MNILELISSELSISRRVLYWLSKPYPHGCVLATAVRIHKHPFINSPLAVRITLSQRSRYPNFNGNFYNVMNFDVCHHFKVAHE